MQEERNEDIQDGDDGLYEHYKFIADKGQKPLRVDKYLHNFIENATRNKIQQAAHSGNILVNDQPVKPNYKVKPMDEVRVVLSFPPRDRTVLPEDIPLDIKYEDDALLVVNKPAGMVVHPGHGNYTGTLVNALAHHFDQLPSLDETDRPGLVHRLDKDTSGLLVIAKTELAMNKLAKQFFDRSTKRLYTAIVWGDLKNDEGTIESYLGRHPKNRLQMSVVPSENEGKYAVTHYKVIERLGYVTVIECRLETGRTHQIRAHMKHIGHTIFNDERYGGDKILKGTTFSKYRQFIDNCFKVLPRQALHARTLGFTHPDTSEFLHFTEPIPKDMEDVIVKWRGYTQSRKD